MFSAIINVEIPTTVKAGLFASKEFERCPNFAKSGISETMLQLRHGSFETDRKGDAEDEHCVLIRIANVGMTSGTSISEYTTFHSMVEDVVLGESVVKYAEDDLWAYMQSGQPLRSLTHRNTFCIGIMTDMLNEHFGTRFEKNDLLNLFALDACNSRAITPVLGNKYARFLAGYEFCIKRIAITDDQGDLVGIGAPIKL